MTAVDQREAALRKEARTRANRRIAWMGHAVVYGSTNLLILVAGGFMPAVIVALAWGIGLAAHGFFGVVGPEMREEMIEAEVKRRLEAEVQLERREMSGAHARSLEHLSASIAHEIRNPITAAKSLVQQMGEDPNATENIEYAKLALEELDRVEAKVAHLLRYARDEHVKTSAIRVDEVLASALETLEPRLNGVKVDRDVEEPLRAVGDPDKARQVIINLVANALEALDGRPDARVEVAAGTNLAGTEAWVRVKDNGPGIAAGDLPRVFEPFHTTKHDGTGLGLAISKKLAEAQGGTLEASSTPGEGAEFVFTLPAEARA
jgi:two-component system sensor histidine kinase HydH